MTANFHKCHTLLSTSGTVNLLTSETVFNNYSTKKPIHNFVNTHSSLNSGKHITTIYQKIKGKLTPLLKLLNVYELECKAHSNLYILSVPV